MDSQICELIGLAKRKIDTEIRIKQLLRDRWGYATFTMANGKLRFIVTDQVALDANIIEETQLNENLLKINAKFVSLDTVFADVMEKMPEYTKPCLSELKAFKMSLSNERFEIEDKLRKDAAFTLQSTRAKGQSLDSVLADPAFTDYKKRAENRMMRIDEKIKNCDTFISQIAEILKR
ncbi:MAG: hypothetical protein PHG06_12360 [Parabacteroides sp.]|nr:hypothetical protein [Parabacteroides sp.]